MLLSLNYCTSTHLNKLRLLLRLLHQTLISILKGASCHITIKTVAPHKSSNHKNSKFDDLAILPLPCGVFFITAAEMMSHYLQSKRDRGWFAWWVSELESSWGDNGAFSKQLWNVLSLGRDSVAFWLTGSSDTIPKDNKSTQAQWCYTENLFVWSTCWSFTFRGSQDWSASTARLKKDSKCVCIHKYIQKYKDTGQLSKQMKFYWVLFTACALCFPYRPEEICNIAYGTKS